MIRRALASMATIALLGACAPSAPGGSGPPDAKERSIVARYDLKVDGFVEAAIRQPAQQMTMRTLADPRVSVRYLLMETVEPLAVRDGLKVWAGLNLIGYNRDGSYKIGGATPSPGIQADPGTGSANAWLEYHPADAKKMTMFSRGQCDVHVARGGLSGSVDCPRLEDPDGRVISLRFSWEGAASE